MSLAAIASLALAIGANTTIFTWASAVFVNPLPGVSDLGRLHVVNLSDKNEGFVSFSYPLGADRRALARLVVGGALTLAVVGLAAGFAASFGLHRVLSALLFEVEAADPATYAVVSSVLVLTSLAAAAIPARRATHIEPSVVLRSE